jgi:hypothetical protein
MKFQSNDPLNIFKPSLMGMIDAYHFGEVKSFTLSPLLYSTFSE